MEKGPLSEGPQVQQKQPQQQQQQQSSQQSSSTNVSASETLTERFKRLPGMQEQRYYESNRQAQEASQLLNRLRQTREEAERLAIDEINRTKRMITEELEHNPKLLELRRKLRDAEREKHDWERRESGRKNLIQKDLERLNEERGRLEERVRKAEEEDLSKTSERERHQQQLEYLEGRLRSLEQDEEILKNTSEREIQDGMNEARKAVGEAQGNLSRLQSEYDQLKREFFPFQNQKESLEKELKDLEQQYNRISGDLMDLQGKRGEAEEEINKTKELCERSEQFYREKKRRLEDLKSGEGEDLEKKRREAIDMRIEADRLFGDFVKVKKETQMRQSQINSRIKSSDERANQVRQQIEQLLKEEHELHDSITKDSEELNRIEGELYRVEGDLRESEERKKSAEDLLSRVEEGGRVRMEMIQEEEKSVKDVERTFFEAQKEFDKAKSVGNEIENRIQDHQKSMEANQKRHQDLEKRFDEVKSKSGDLEGRYSRLEFDVEEGKRQVEDCKRNVEYWEDKWNNLMRERRNPLVEEKERVKNELNQVKMNLRTLIPGGGVSRLESWQRDLHACQERIYNLQSELSGIGQKAPWIIDPANHDPETIRNQLQSLNEEIRARLTSPEGLASPRLQHQLAIEAEAIMRAEAAAALHRKQTLIEREAGELKELRLQRSPRVVLDEEARARMWGLHQEEVEEARIAEKVLELCESRNIKSQLSPSKF